jgi:hypothetical protein
MAPELPDPVFAKIVVLTPDAEAREALKHRLREAIAAGLVPEAFVRVTQLVFGPYSPFPVEFRVMGPDPSKLYEISDKALDITKGVPNVRQPNRDGGNRTPILLPTRIVSTWPPARPPEERLTSRAATRRTATGAGRQSAAHRRPSRRQLPRPWRRAAARDRRRRSAGRAHKS